MESLANLFKDFAFEKGFKIQSITNDKDEKALLLEISDAQFIVENNSDDPSFFRIILPNIDRLDGNEEKRTIINELNKIYKMGKCILVNDNIYMTAEQFVFSKESIDDLFLRMLSVLISMHNEYKTKFPSQLEQQEKE